MRALIAGKLLRASLLLLLFCRPNVSARILLVPESYATINGAMVESIAEDTILVNRGIYPEQLWYPAHRIYVMSHYELTGDTLDVAQTVIEGYDYADHDTATVALFLPGAANGSKLCGFTLQGGHGILLSNGLRVIGVFLADSCAAVICHNAITDNVCEGVAVGRFSYCSGIFRGNHVFANTFNAYGLRVGYNLYWDPVLIEGNTFGPNPSSPEAYFPCLFVNSGGRAIIRHNTFRNVTGSWDIAISSYRPDSISVTNNVFDSLSVSGAFAVTTSLVRLDGTQSDITVHDNVFTNSFVQGGGALVAIADQYLRAIHLEGNLFEHNFFTGFGNQVATGPAHFQGYSVTVRNNIFRSNHGDASGALYFMGGGPPGSLSLALEYNLMEACSSLRDDPMAANVLCGAYDGPITAQHNIFRRNYPRIVTVVGVLPDSIANFTLNYWGDPSGPYHPTLNPDGLGDAVGDSVLFDPWLTDSLIDEAHESLPPLPTEYSLESYPNPFNLSARLKLIVPEPGRFALELYDLTGRRVREIWEGVVVIDREVSFSADGLASGVYFARATDRRNRSPVATTKVMLLK